MIYFVLIQDAKIFIVQNTGYSQIPASHTIILYFHLKFYIFNHNERIIKHTLFSIYFRNTKIDFNECNIPYFYIKFSQMDFTIQIYDNPLQICTGN